MPHPARALTYRPLASLLLLSLLPPIAFSPASAQAPARPSPKTLPQPSLPQLRAGFLNPPSASRPMVRWWWFGIAAEKPEILRELQQMKADGIGGAELAFEYPQVLDDPAHGLKNEPFLSPTFLDCVHYAQAEGRRLGLRIDITLGSGWPYGGPATTLDEAAHHLRTVQVPLPAGASTVATPTLAAGETLLYSAIVNGEASSSRGTRGHAAAPAPPAWDPTSARPFTSSGTSHSLPPASITRTALFFIDSHTGQEVKRAASGAEGWVLDPFSRSAVATHLKSVGQPLLSAFGSTPPYAVFSDSLEAYGADWTPSLASEFKRRRGYDLLPHLPELFAGNTPAAQNIRHDYGRTLTELIDENYLTQINSWALAHHTLFRSQTYGDPAVSFSSQRLVALPEGEGPQWRQFSTLRWATSANHVFGNDVTSGETFTWLHSPVFRATPLDMKAEADVDFITGENQLIFHGWPYSPPQASANGEPGWSLYAAAVFNDHNPWHPVMPDVTRYISRVSFLLRQGSPANQVAILLPTDDAWANFSPGHASVTAEMARLITPGLMSTILSAGYNVDFIDADAIDSTGFGSHQILILPPTDRIPLHTLQKIDAFVSHGGHAISVGRIPSRSEAGKPLTEIASLAGQLFNPQKSTFVPAEDQLLPALYTAATPDLHLLSHGSNVGEPIGFIRRKLPTADIYFIVNTSNQPLETSVAFSSRYKSGHEWSPDTGTRSETTTSPENVNLRLAPYESRIFVFSQETAQKTAPPPSFQSLADLSTGWKVSFPGIGKSLTENRLADWTSDPSTLHYSGEAIYTRDFTLPSAPGSPVMLEVSGGQPVSPVAPHTGPPALLPNGLPDPHRTGTGPGMRAWYEPPVREAALVFVNGQPAGALWHPPYRLDVSKLLKSGKNQIEIRVYNTALNAWSALPPHDYKPLVAKYGDRFQMQDLDKVTPVSSGILGQIHLVTSATQEAK